MEININEMDNQQPSSEQEKVQRLSRKGVLYNIKSSIIWETPSIDNKIYLYFLRSNDTIRYVGITNDPNTRLTHHINYRLKNKSHKNNWIINCIENNFEIEMLVKESFSSYEDALIKEEYYINSIENLTNYEKNPTKPNIVKCYLYDLEKEESIEFESRSAAAKYLNIASGSFKNKIIKRKYLFNYDNNFLELIEKNYKIKSMNIKTKDVKYFLSYSHAAYYFNCSINMINLVLLKKRSSIKRKYLLINKSESFDDCIIKENTKKIICLNDNNIFDSIKNAASYYKIDESGITKVCKGKRKTINKLIFKYYQ